jgi:hypothetical protein
VKAEAQSGDRRRLATVARHSHRDGGRHDEREVRVPIPKDIKKADDLRRVDHLRDGESQAEEQARSKSGEHGGSP